MGATAQVPVDIFTEKSSQVCHVYSGFLRGAEEENYLTPENQHCFFGGGSCVTPYPLLSISASSLISNARVFQHKIVPDVTNTLLPFAHSVYISVS